MKQMPTDSLVTAYSKQEYFLLSSMTQPQRTPLRMSRAAWLSMRCLRQMARGVLPWESSTSQLMLVSSRQRMEKKNFFSQAQCRGVLWQQSTMLRSISLQLSSVCMISTLSLGGSSGAPCSSPLIFMKQQKMGVRPYLSRLLIFTPYSSNFMQISGEESKFVALETKWCRALRSLRSRMSAEAPCSPRMLSISCTLNFCLFLMISISGTWFSKLQLFIVLPYARSKFMNFSCPFRAAYSRGVDRLMSRMLEVSPFSSRYSRHLWLSQSGPRLMRMRGTGLMSTSSVLKSEPSRFHMQKRCRGVLPSLFWELKNLSIHFMKFLSSTSDGNLIRKCWMPHFLQFSFSFSTRGSHTMLRGSAPFSTRNPTSFSRLVSCSTYSPNAFWMQASCTFSLSLSASGCSFRKLTQFRLKLECTVWVKFFIRKTMNSKPKQSAFLNSRRRTLGSTWESLSSTKKTSALPRQAMLVRQQTKWLFLVGGWMSKGISFMSSWIPIEFSFSMQQLTGLCCFSVMISESAPQASSCLIRMPCISWYSLGRMYELSLVRCSQQSFSLMEQRRCRQVSPMLVYWQFSWQMLELSRYSIILKNSGVPRGFFSSKKMRWWWWGKFITLLPFISSSCAQWKWPFSTATSQGQKFFLLGICSMILRRNITSSMLPQAAAQCSIVLLLQSRLKLPCASFSSWKKMSLWWLRRATTRGLRRKLSKLLRIPLPMMSCTRLLLPPPAAKCRIEKRSLVSSCGFTRWSSSSSDTHSSCWWITAQCRALRPSSLLWFMYSLSLSFSNMNFITLYRPCWAATIRGVTFFLSIWVSCSELCLCRISMALGDSSVAAQWTGFLLRESPTLNSEMCFRMQVSSSVLELMVAQWMGLQKFSVQFCLSIAALRNWSWVLFLSRHSRCSREYPQIMAFSSMPSTFSIRQRDRASFPHRTSVGMFCRNTPSRAFSCSTKMWQISIPSSQRGMLSSSRSTPITCHQLPLCTNRSCSSALIISFWCRIRQSLRVRIVYPAFSSLLPQSQGTRNSLSISWTCRSNCLRSAWWFERIISIITFLVSSTPMLTARFFSTALFLSLPSRYCLLNSLSSHFEQHLGIFFSGSLSGIDSEIMFCSLSPSSSILFFLFLTPFGRPRLLFAWHSSQLSSSFTVSSLLLFEQSLFMRLLISSNDRCRKIFLNRAWKLDSWRSSSYTSFFLLREPLGLPLPGFFSSFLQSEQCEKDSSDDYSPFWSFFLFLLPFGRPLPRWLSSSFDSPSEFSSSSDSSRWYSLLNSQVILLNSSSGIVSLLPARMQVKGKLTMISSFLMEVSLLMRKVAWQWPALLFSCSMGLRVTWSADSCWPTSPMRSLNWRLVTAVTG